MKRNASLAKRLIVATGLTLVSFAASADDNSMSVLTGDSYAYFNGLEFRLGQFNVPHAKTMAAGDPAAQPANAQGRTFPRVLLAGPMPDRVGARRNPGSAPEGAMQPPRERATPAPRVWVPSPFRDDTGA